MIEKMQAHPIGPIFVHRVVKRLHVPQRGGLIEDEMHLATLIQAALDAGPEHAADDHPQPPRARPHPLRGASDIDG